MINLFKSHQGYWIALEYERWRKDTKRIYLTLMNHIRGIKAQHYKGVYYLFERENDRAHYQKLFDTPTWPRYQRAEKSGKVISLADTFKPDEIENLRKCFVFALEPVFQNQKSVVEVVG